MLLICVSFDPQAISPVMQKPNIPIVSTNVCHQSVNFRNPENDDVII